MKIDLNGTGVLVDVTSYVDLQELIVYRWGRSANNPFSPEPQPGSISFTLWNNDGRFTPGNTSVYTVGLIVGALIEWTCDSRVQRFRAEPPTVDFPAGVGGQSRVSVTGQDALALLAKREMRQMVDEVAFCSQPAAYWVLDDSGSQALDSSGNAECPLLPLGDDTQLTWAQGVGPSTDGRAALMLQSQAVSPVVDGVGPAVSNQRALGTSGVATSFYVADASGIGNTRWGFGFSLWFSVRDIYGPTSTTGTTADGPYVAIANVGSVELLWRIPDRRLIIAYNGTGGGMEAMTDLPAIQPGTTNHVFMSVQSTTSLAAGSGGVARISIRLWLNGVETSTYIASTGSVTPVTPTVILGSRGYIGTGFGVGGTPTTYSLSGTLACCAVYTLPAANSFYATAGTFSGSGWLVGTGTGDVADFYPVGLTGTSESSSSRFARLGKWLRRSDIAFSAVGTAQGVVLGGQSTEGKSMLQAMCSALAFEERVVDCATLAGVETVRAWMSSNHRPTSPTLTVDVDADGEGQPVLTADASGVAAQCTVNGFSAAVRWLDASAPARWRDTSATLDAATDDLDAMRALAQFRTLLGRVTSMAPAKVTVDAVTSKNNLTATLEALQPMTRVRVTNLPSSIGFTQVDAILVGVAERHGPGSARFELQLTPPWPYPDAVEDVTHAGGIPENYSFTNPALWPISPVTGNFPVVTVMGSGSTTVDLRMWGLGNTGDPGMFFPPGALVDTVYVQIDDEIIGVTSASAVVYGVYSYGTTAFAWVGTQTLTITRGQLGTTAAAHDQSGGGLITTSGSTVGPETPGGWTAPRAVFLHMFDSVAF